MKFIPEGFSNLNQPKVQGLLTQHKTTKHSNSPPQKVNTGGLPKGLLESWKKKGDSFLRELQIRLRKVTNGKAGK